MSGKVHFDVDNGDRCIVKLNGEEISHVLVANTHFGYVIRAVQPVRLTPCGTEIVTERVDGVVEVTEIE